ncbi:hypothetical protein C8Q80DRAFT_1119223 [Daedaleopsis nitida]|nr:hypothetical protein C8Q80DRAFT_1119223 [Daedaleopsis nitida]
MFLSLPRLRHLVLHGGCGGRLDEVPQVELPELATLRLLPRLREFGFRPNETVNAPTCEFLKVHGAKLDVLSLDMLGVYGEYRQALFDWCPNITELRLLGTIRRPVSIPFLSRSQPHRTLRRVTFVDLDLHPTKTPWPPSSNISQNTRLSYMHSMNSVSVVGFNGLYTNGRNGTRWYRSEPVSEVTTTGMRS